MRLTCFKIKTTQPSPKGGTVFKQKGIWIKKHGRWPKQLKFGHSQRDQMVKGWGTLRLSWEAHIELGRWHKV